MTCLVTVSAASATAQTPRDFTRVYGVSDRDLPTPTHSVKTQTDSSALQEIAGFVKAAGIIGWQGMTADGTITYVDDPVSYPAHLTVLGSDCYRLDVTKADGTQSIVMNKERGIFISTKGKTSSISSDVSMLGLLAFPKLLSPDYPSAASILSDQGSATIAGSSLRRITLDDPAPYLTGTPWKTEDLYLDPQSGRLIESAAYVHLSSADASMYMLETSYSDYKPEGTGSLPHTFAQSVNGINLWTLQLKSVSLTTLPNASVFEF